MESEKPSQNSGKDRLTKVATANDIANEASIKLRCLAMPADWGMTREGALRRAARILGMSPHQAKRIVYGEVKNIPAHIMDNIRTAYARLEANAEARADLQIQHAIKARNDFYAADKGMAGKANSVDGSQADRIGEAD